MLSIFLRYDLPFETEFHKTERSKWLTIKGADLNNQHFQGSFSLLEKNGYSSTFCFYVKNQKENMVR